MTIEELKAQVAGLTEAQAAAVLRAVPLIDKIQLLPDADSGAILAQVDRLTAERAGQAPAVSD